MNFFFSFVTQKNVAKQKENCWLLEKSLSRQTFGMKCLNRYNKESANICLGLKTNITMVFKLMLEKKIKGFAMKSANKKFSSLVTNETSEGKQRGELDDRRETIKEQLFSYRIQHRI